MFRYETVMNRFFKNYLENRPVIKMYIQHPVATKTEAKGFNKLNQDKLI